MSPGVEYLLRRIIELEQAMALMVERNAALEKNQRKPRVAKPRPPGG
jgi:hypothetical protein